MKKYKIFFAAILFCLPLMSNNLSEEPAYNSKDCLKNTIYDAIEILPFDPSGYFATESSLDFIFREKEIKTVIELGSWAGASTRFFGYRVGEGGKVYAIDHWRGTPNHRGEMTDTKLPYIYQLFLSNIYHVKLTDRVIPIRMTTDEAAKALIVKADLIYVDASRDSEGVYNDIINWAPHINEGGIICGTEWRDKKVRAGVQKAAQELGKTIHSDRKGFFWTFE